MMTGIERISNILNKKPVDRLGVYEHFWDGTYPEYRKDGKVGADESFEDHFGFDMQEGWPFNLTADLDFTVKIVAETDETVTTLDGNGAYLRRHKKRETTPEHVDFTVKTRRDWEEYKPFLVKPDERRINFERYRQSKEAARKANRFFTWSGVNVFECMHPIAGHEHMLAGMALDPGWILDMAETYANLTVALMEILFAREGKPDGLWFCEDMGFKERPFMSPAMYGELIFPSHKKTIDFARSLKLPVIMHSCGYVEPLLPKMIEAGINGYQTIEIKAGMDLLRIHKNYGDKIALLGGIDVRCLYSNDRDIIGAELKSKIPVVKDGFGYILSSDHSIPPTVRYDSFRYFLEKGLELGKY